MILSDADRACLLLPPARDDLPELGADNCGDCGDALLSDRERHRQTCNPCNSRRRDRYNARMAKALAR